MPRPEGTSSVVIPLPSLRAQHLCLRVSLTDSSVAMSHFLSTPPMLSRSCSTFSPPSPIKIPCALPRSEYPGLPCSYLAVAIVSFEHVPIGVLICGATIRSSSSMPGITSPRPPVGLRDLPHRLRRNSLSFRRRSSIPSPGLAFMRTSISPRRPPPKAR